MSVRWQFEQNTRFIVPFKVEIVDSQYGGNPITIENAGGRPVQVELGQRNADPFEKVKGSFITIRLSGKKGDYEDLFDRNNDRWRVKLYVDGEFESVFIPIPDTFNDYDQGGKYEVEFKAANLSLFKQKDAWTVLEVDADDIPIKSRLQTIHAIINDLFDLPIIDGSVFSPVNGLGASPLLKQWVDYTRLEGLNAYQALELLIPKGHQYRIAKGAVFIIPVTESQFSGFRYSGPSLGFPSSETFNDNFTAVFKGNRYSKPRRKLQQYDGVRRIYDPLESANAVPSGSLNAEDFGIEEPSDAQTVEFPIGWERVNYPGGFDTRLVSTSVGGSRFAWEIPETAPTIQAGIQPAVWTVPSKEILAGQRLLIRLTADYDSRNSFAIFPLTIRVGSKFLNKPFFQVGEPQWEDVGVLGVGVNSRSGYVDYEFLTPPIPRTGQLQLTIETPTPDGASWEFSEDHVLRISEISIDPVDEEGEVLRRSETLAGSKGDVYEYTEGFGDGFSSFTPGALRNTTGSGGFTEGGLVLTELWRYTGEPDQLPLDQLEAKYLFSQLSRDLDRISGTADVFDFIALIEGKRVNYISTDFRYGNSEIELIEIEAHNLDATVEDRREGGGGSYGGGGGSPDDDRIFIDRLQSIGELRETIDNEERTSVRAEFDIVARKGIEYWIVNEAELSRTDRQAGIYPINPVTTDSEGNPLFPGDAGYEDGTKEYGPGLLEALPIQSSLINAPEGSLIYKAPGQTETEQNVGEEKDEEFDERIETVNFNLDQLEDDLIAAQLELDELNNVALPELESKQNTLESYFDDPNNIPADFNFFEGIVANEIWGQTGVFIEGWFDSVFTNTLMADRIITNHLTAGSITTPKIGAGQVTAIKIDVDDLGANNAFIDQLMAQTLILRTGGIIRNSGSDFEIDMEGIRLKGTDFIGGTNRRKIIFNFDETARGEIYHESALSPSQLEIRAINTGLLMTSGLSTFILSDETLGLGFNNDSIIFESASSTTGIISPTENGRIEIEIDGVTRYIQLYS